MKRFLALLTCAVLVFLAPAAEALTKSDFEQHLWELMKEANVLTLSAGTAPDGTDKTDDVLIPIEADKVTGLDLSELTAGADEVTSLKGIEKFTKLETLNLTGASGLTTISLSGLAELATLNLTNCTGLTSVTVDGATKLATLTFSAIPDADHNKLTTLVVTNSGTKAANDAGINMTLPAPTAVATTVALTTLNLKGSKLDLTSGAILTATNPGIPDFVNLTDLNLSGVTFDSATVAPIDLAIEPLTKLVSLDVSKSPLTTVTTTAVLSNLKSLNVSGCEDLAAFGDTQNNATTFDVGYAKNLAELDVSGTAIVTLELGNQQMLSLKSVKASGCEKLTAVNTKGVTNADGIVESYLPVLETLDLSGNAALETVYYIKDAAPAVNVANTVYINMPKLKTLNLACVEDEANENIYNAQLISKALVSADLSYLTKLGTNTANYGVTASDCTALTELVLKGVPMGETTTPRYGVIDVSGCTALTTLDLTPCVNLGTLNVSSTALPSLDLSKNTHLSALIANSTSALTALDVSGHTALTRVTANRNTALVSVDISGIGASTNAAGASKVMIENNTKLAELNAKGAYVDSLHASSNALTSIDVSGNTALNYLHVIANKLTALDVSDNTALATLLANNNNLKALDLTKNLVLTSLNVRSNALAKLDLRNQPSWTAVAAGAQDGELVDIPSPYNPYYFVQVIKGQGTAGATTFDFKDLGLTETDMGYVKNVKGDNVMATDVTGTVATFATAPAEITYDYQTGIHNSNSVEDLMDVTIEVGVADEGNGDENTEDAPVISVSSSSTTDVYEGEDVNVVVNATQGANITWTLSPAAPTWLTETKGTSSYTLAGKPEKGTADTYEFTVTATNSAGTDSADIAITVTAAVEPKFAEVTDWKIEGKVSEDVNLIVSLDAGTKATWDTEPKLSELGLTGTPATDGKSYTISGKPTKAYTGDVVITATNAAGVDSDDIYVEITSANGSSGSSSGGCDAGFGALAVAVLGLLGLKRK